MMPRLPVNNPRCRVATISPDGVTRFCSGIRYARSFITVIPGWCVSTRPGISRFRVRCFASPRKDGAWIVSLLAMTDKSVPPGAGRLAVAKFYPDHPASLGPFPGPFPGPSLGRGRLVVHIHDLHA